MNKEEAKPEGHTLPEAAAIATAKAIKGLQND